MQQSAITIFYVVTFVLFKFLHCTDSDLIEQDECLNHLFTSAEHQFLIKDLLLSNKSGGRHFLKHFQFEPGYTNLNSASFGATPKIVTLCDIYWRQRAETNPDRWFRYELRSKLDKVLHSMAEYMNVKDSKDLIFVPNVSAGVNMILQSINLRKNDVIVYFSEAFGTVVYSIQLYAQQAGALVKQVKVSFPVDDSSILSSLESTLRRYRGHVKLICISHISSTPSALFPIESMQLMARRYSAQLLVDGAHALGQIHLDLTSMDPDYYVANGHKRFMSSRGTAIVYVKKNLREGLDQLISVPHYAMDQNILIDESDSFDYTRFLSMSTALTFRQLIGGDATIFKYNQDLISYATKTLTQKWRSDVITPVSKNKNLTMINIRLPLYHYKLVNVVIERLMQSQRTFLIPFYHNGYFYFRLSVQIYNQKSDIDELAQQLLDVKRELEPLIIESFPCRTDY